MAVSDDYLAFVRDQFDGWHEISTRRMFGGAGIYVGAAMFALVADDVLYFKVGAANAAEYERAGAPRFKPYADRDTTMSFAEVPAHVLDDRRTLHDWADRALAVQRAAQ